MPNSIPSPNVIVSDIMMDVMDGYEFYNELVKVDEYRSVTFIFLTAKSGENERMKGLKKVAANKSNNKIGYGESVL